MLIFCIISNKYISNDESSLLIVSIYALMASSLIDEIEKRNVYTIPEAFLQSDWPKD